MLIIYAFWRLEFYPVFPHSSDDSSHIFLVLFQTLQVYKDIAQIYYETYLDIWLQGSVDSSLEYSWRIGEPKRHDQVLVSAVFGGKRCFPFLFFLYPDIVVGVFDVQHGVVLGS